MKAVLASLLALLAGGVAAQPPAPPARVTLTRLECGTIEERDFSFYSDTHAEDGRARTLVDSCYLIRHGDEYLLWETGLPGRYEGRTETQDTSVMRLPERIVPQLARIGVRPEQVRFVGISHYHDDHTGQAADFPAATLLIGAQDWDVIRAAPAGRFDTAGLLPWTAGTARVEPVRGDRDVWGDGSVVMLATPGHTPGHHSLLVRLRGRTFLLTGDAAHSAGNYATGGVPAFNTDRADTLASLDRLKATARNLRATVIVQHEAADVHKLPGFPRAAE